ncbi:MAG TPA: VWA domain-containing protein [Polyangiaceae bacterium]|nr:VWA domain-containing protein [Polyangiaceae bacterium]
MNHIRSLGGLTLALLLAGSVTCGEDRAQPLPDLGGFPNGGENGFGGRGGSGADVPDASADEADAAVDAGMSGGSGGGDGGFTVGEGAVVNCGTVTCRGAGKCIQQSGEPTCVCDEGYTLLEGGSCVVDETCIELRLIEESCRQRVEREPALGMAFYVETCAGTTARPEILGDVSTAFKVLEDGNDLGDESFATVFDRNVESYIVIALDMSSSVADNAVLLADLIERVNGLVDDLTPGPDDAPVRMLLVAFGRSIDVKTEFTFDLSEVRDAIAEIESDPGAAVAEPDGTNLNGVVNAAIETLDDAIEARIAADSGAVITAGTLIVVTDGRDTGGVTLKTIPTRFNVISIGVSGDINDEELTRVGPQGSFLAPEEVDRVEAFDTVAERVKEYPDRAYLLGYCSPAVAGSHRVIATTANLEAHENASCQFNATAFGSGNACNEQFIQNYCEEPIHGCGAFLACAPPCKEPPVDAGPVQDNWAFSK